MNVHVSLGSDETSGPVIDASDADWWRGAVIYQIYPRSFQDASGDGIGDLAGIAGRMGYIASLGVDAIWISPFYTSPMKDFGYDVADYVDVDPMFGNLADFDALVTEAHAHGIRVMIDLVVSHTSDRHAWFEESRASRDNPKADWYVWADPKPDGTPPNNWLSIFGGVGWEWDTRRRQYYLHNFLREQPDLNLHNEEVQEAVLDVFRFWLDRGVDGFRLDVINFYFHDAALTDNPPLGENRRNGLLTPDVNPYNYQDQIHSKNRPENEAFLERVRGVLDAYSDKGNGTRAAVGEIGDALYSMELMRAYTSGTKRMQMCYSFDFLSPAPVDAKRAREVIEKFEEGVPDGWVCWAFSNHDVVRHATRWGEHPKVEGHDAYLRMLAALLLSLRGSVCLYQGEELGLGEAELAFEQLQDPYGIQFWPEFKGRDGCRTPMVWEADAHAAGFSTAEPWLPVPAEHRDLAVSEQEHVPGSLLNHYRRMLAFRRDHPALAKGTFRFIDVDEPQVFAFERERDGTRILCLFNMGDAEIHLDLPEGTGDAVGGHPFAALVENGTVTLPPWGAFYAEMN